MLSKFSKGIQATPYNACRGNQKFQRNLACLETCSGDADFFRWFPQLKLKRAKEECKEIPIVLTCLHGHLHQDDTAQIEKS